MKKALFFLAVLLFVIKAQAQNVGIGTTLPLLKLHIKGGLLLDSTNGTTPVSGAGTRLMWIPAKAAFRTGNVSGAEWDDINIGVYSFAVGLNPIASGASAVAIGVGSNAPGNASIALGRYSTANGGGSASLANSTANGSFSTAIGGGTTNADNSIAIGFSATANRYNSIAIGAFATAGGDNGIVMGYHTKSTSYGGFVTGLFNDTTDAVNSVDINSLNRIFQIGNGTADNARSNAMTVLQNGNIGIGTSVPQTKFHIKGGLLIDSTNGSTPVSGSGTRMMWIPAKSAFRAGAVISNKWDDTNIGNTSFASGFESIASGSVSTAIGAFTTASGNYSTAIGYNTTASGFISTALGSGTNSISDGSTAMGVGTTASGFSSTSMGFASTASGYSSVVIGYQTKSKSYGGFVTGIFNDSTNAASSITNNPLNRLFQIGNGTSDVARSNAMTVLQNGNVGIGELNPAVPLNFASALGDKISLWGNGSNHYGFSIQPSLLQVFTMDGSNDIAFGYGSSAALTENVRFKGNGNVGIGTTTPAYMLTVKNDINVDNGDSNAGTTTNTLKFGGNGTGESIGSNRTTATNQWGLDFYTNSVNRMAISLGGNIGIGTTAPTAKLSVNGAANNATGTWGVFSDERIKTITNDFTDGLNVIRQIQPVSFVYNDKAPFKSDEEQIGIVAQDLEKIAPYMVSKQAYEEFTDLREVNNQAYVFLLINAVKEQQVQIEIQQKENKVQKERMDALEKLVKELSRKVN